MPVARYFLPDHPLLTEVYSRNDLRALLQAGELSRSDMVTDDETGLSHLLGDLLAMPFPDAGVLPSRTTSPLQTQPIPSSHEFRADTPLPRSELDWSPEEAEEHDDGQETLDDPAGDDSEEDSASGGDTTTDEAGEPSPDEEEEELLYLGHPSWFAFPKSLVITLVCISSAIFFQQHHVGLEWITLLGSIAGLILLFISLDRTTTTYFVTTRRVELEFGIIGRNTKEVRICDIRAIDVVQHGWAALMGLGTVKFDSSASAGPEVCFRNVRKPHVIKQLVRELQG